MDTSVLAAIIIAAGLVGGVLIYLWTRRGRTPNTADNATSAQAVQQMLQLMQSTQAELARQRETITADQARLRQELQKALGSSQQVMQERLAEANQTINLRLGQAAKMFNDISKGLGTVSEFSKQLSNLRDVFMSPKLRGNIGEEILKQLLEQVLPIGQFTMQFKFKEGQVVDAIVKTKQGLIPIDSKFPLENFRLINQARTAGDEAETSARRQFVRDVKKHIEAIQSKYILPEEGTVDFAVMYVPSEAVYFEIVQNNQELLEFAGERRVYLVSPNTFYYFLKIIMIGLEGARMEEVSRQVLNLLRTVQKDTSAFGEELAIMTRHVTNAKNASDRVTGKFERLSGSLDHVRLLDATKSTQSAPKLSALPAEQLTIDVDRNSTDD
ncbi:MAG: DNA recombination protein RmuC [Parcubacteria group bacterium]